MMKFLKPKYLNELSLGLGVLACFCSLWLYQNADDRALLNSMHPGAILLWVLSAVMVVAVVVLTRELGGKMRYDRAFPASLNAAAGIVLCAVGVAVTAFGELTSKTDAITMATGVVGLLAAVSLCYLAWCRSAQMRPHFLPLCVVLIYLMMHMLCRYRVWSSEPELLRYFFALAATVLLTLAMFQRLAFSVGMGNRQQYLLFFLLGGFFAMAALPGDGDKWFLAGMAVWTMTDRCSLKVRKRRKKTEAA